MGWRLSPCCKEGISQSWYRDVLYDICSRCKQRIKPVGKVKVYEKDLKEPTKHYADEDGRRSICNSQGLSRVLVEDIDDVDCQLCLKTIEKKVADKLKGI